VAVGLLFGLSGALTAAFLAGARRADTAYERFRAAANGADAVIQGSQAGLGDLDWSSIVSRPEIEAAVAFGAIGQSVRLAGAPERDTGMYALPPTAPVGLYTAVEVPQLVDGRLPDPARDDEVVVSTVAHRELGVSVGDVLTLETQTEAADDADAFDGPTLRLQVVGIGQTPLGATLYAGEPLIYPTARVLDDHPDIARTTNLVVQLRHHRNDLPALRAALRDEFGTDVPVVDLTEAASRVRHGTTFERNGLLLLAAGAAVVGLLTAAQTLARSMDDGSRATGTLRALGFPRAARVAAMALPSGVTALVSVAVMGASAVGLSTRFPTGLARQIEPDPGVHADWAVLAAVAVLLVLSVAASAVVGAWIVAARTPEAARAWRSRGRPRRARLPLVVDVGARFALQPPNRGARSPLRPVIVSAVLGLLGVVATATVAAGLDDVLTSPARSGQHWDALYFAEQPPAFEEELLARADVTGIARVSFASVSAGGTPLATFAIDPVMGPDSFSVLTGRAPQQPGEIMLGVATARRLQLRLGEAIELGGDGDRAALRIVGLGLTPQALGSSYDEGAWVTPEGMERVGDLSLFGEAAPGFLVRFDATTPRAEIERFPSPEQGVLGNTLDAEAEVVTNLRGVGRLPLLAGTFFALLGVASVGHIVWSTSRRRLLDLGVLRALGCTSWQLRAVVTWQGLAMGVVALVIGIPLGLAAGAWTWRSVADAISLVDVGPVPWSFLATVVPLTLVVTGLLAAASAGRVVRRSQARSVTDGG
jgi:ABC-type lipoprotein release transport system permease subunit